MQRPYPLRAVGPPGVPVADPLDHADERQPAHRRDPFGQAGDQLRAAARGHGEHADRTGRPRLVAACPVLEHLDDRTHHLVGNRDVRRVVGEQRAQPGPPAEVGQPAQGTPRFGLLARRYLAGQWYTDRGEARRPQPPGRDRHPRPAEERRGGGERRLRDGVVEARPGAPVTPSTADRVRVVEAPAQELHPAVARLRVLPHGLLLGGPGLGDPPVPRRVVLPRLAGGDPAAPHPADRAVHVQHLEHQLQPVPAQLHHRLQRLRREWTVTGGQYGQHGAHLFLGRERERGEVPPDGRVLGAGQQQHVGAAYRPAGPADLLVVRDRRGRRAQVYHEAEVGLVEPHAQRRGGHQRLDPVGQQVLLGGAAVGVLGLPGVRGDQVAARSQEVRRLLGRGDGQRVDDARAGELVEVVGQPGQPVRRAGQPQHAQPQRFPVQRAA